MSCHRILNSVTSYDIEWMQVYVEPLRIRRGGTDGVLVSDLNAEGPNCFVVLIRLGHERHDAGIVGIW